MDKILFNQKEFLNALERSGYLLESEISEYLNELGFIIENSQVIIDPFTGKSREIDLTAENFGFRDRTGETRCVAKVRFVFEIKNNSAPIVLLTKFNHSPNIEDWLGLKRWITIPKKLKNVYYEGYWEKLIQSKRGSIFTQYCSFQKKKGNDEMMALHPENIYSGLSKISQYCEEAIDREDHEENDDGYWRDFIYLPILLVNEELYELHSKNNEYTLNKVESSLLAYNYHYKNIPSMAYVYVVTKQGFQDFLQSILIAEEQVEDEMIDLRKKHAVE